MPICDFVLHFQFRITLYEPHREKTGFLHYAKTKTQISFAVTAKLISAFVFATRIVQSLYMYLLNPKFQASMHFCDCTARFVWDLVGNPEDGFSRNEAHIQKNILIHCYLYYLVIYLAAEMFTSGFGLRKKYFFMINT